MPDGDTPARRFRLIDAIVLVACAALMLSADRAIHWFWVWGDPVASFTPSETRRMAWSLALAAFIVPLLGSLLARREDRSRLRNGAPGLLVYPAVATVAAARLLGWSAQASTFALFQGRQGVYEIRWTVEVLNYLGNDLRKDVAIAILASWLALTIVGRWNPDKTWDDRLGRLIGVGWMGFYLGAPLMALWP